MKGIVTLSVTLVAIAALCGAGLCAQAGPTDPAGPQAVASNTAPTPNNSDLAQSSAASRMQPNQAVSPIPKMVGQASGAPVHHAAAQAVQPGQAHPIHGAPEAQPPAGTQILSQRLGQPSSEVVRPSVAKVPVQPASAVSDKTERPVATKQTPQAPSGGRQVHSEILAAQGRCPECPPCPPAVRSEIKTEGSGPAATPARAATTVPEPVQAVKGQDDRQPMPAQVQSPVNSNQDRVQQQGTSPGRNPGGAITVQPVGGANAPAVQHNVPAAYGYPPNPQVQTGPPQAGGTPSEGWIRPTPSGTTNWNPQLGAGYPQQQPVNPTHGLQQMGPQVQQPKHQSQTGQAPPQTGQYTPQTSSGGPQINQYPSQPVPPPPQPGQYTPPAAQQQNSWQQAPAGAGTGAQPTPTPAGIQ
ncbi:MAG: hypothetical protein V2B18_03265 [Pseudomonadota bacterium]